MGLLSPKLSSRTRVAVGFLGSLCVHGAAFLVLSLSPLDCTINVPVEVTWLDLDNELGFQTATPRSNKKQSGDSGDAAKDKGERKSSKKQEKNDKEGKGEDKKKGDEGELLGAAPNQAALVLLMRTAMIRKGPYAPGVKRLMGAFYDFQVLLNSDAVDVLRDFDVVLIATPNPYQLVKTFIAARTSLLEDQLKEQLLVSVRSRGGTIRWSKSKNGTVGQLSAPPRLANDPRVLVLHNFWVYLGRRKLVETAMSETDPSVKSNKKVSLNKRLAELSGETTNKNDAAVMVEAINLSRLIRLPSSIPTPQAVRLMLYATEPGRARGVANFESVAKAKEFLTQIAQLVVVGQQNIMLRMLGLASLLDKVRLARRGRTIIAKLTLSTREGQRLLNIWSGLIPQVPLPGKRTPKRRKKRDSDYGKVDF